MAYSYKSYSDTKETMKRYVNAAEGAIIYSIGRTRFMAMAKEAGAIYKIGKSALVNTELFEEYLERYRENPVSLPKHVWNKKKVRKENGDDGLH